MALSWSRRRQMFVLLLASAVMGGLLVASAALGTLTAKTKRDDCINTLYPIALGATTVQGAKPGDILPNIINGGSPGNEGWLSWTGNISERVLVRSLTPPGDSTSYRNPDNTADHVVSTGDWIPGRPGVVNSRAIRDALEKLKTVDIRVPIWNRYREDDDDAADRVQKRTNGDAADQVWNRSHGDIAYHVSDFANVRITEYRLRGKNRITARYLGSGCGKPVPDRTPVGRSLNASTREDTSLQIILTLTDPDPGSHLTAHPTQPEHGTVRLTATPHCSNVPHQGTACTVSATYTPAADFSGTDHFIYTVRNGKATSPPATATIAVSEVNDPPIARLDRYKLHPVGGPTPPDTLTLYLTERFNRSLAKATISSGAATVDTEFVTGLPPSGPDSVIFDQNGNLLVSNTDVGAISLIDADTGRVIDPQVNQTTVDRVADLALDPSGSAVWAIKWDSTDPDAITRVTLPNGTAESRNPDGLTRPGGITFNDTGERLFVASHSGSIAEINPTDGHVLRSVKVPGSPDGMTYDPTTQHVFASGCSGLCEVNIGTDAAPVLTFIGVRDAVDGDGIAADGKGHIYVVADFCCVDLLDLSSNTSSRLISNIPSADDIAPLVGVGSPQPPTAELRFPAAGLLANDSPGPSNETGQPLAVTAVSASSGTHGTVTLAGDTVTYVPTAGYLGTADFGYTVCDSGTTSSHPDPKCTAGTVSVNVTNGQPAADNQHVATAEDTTAQIALHASDPDNDPLAYTVSTPQHGQLAGDAPNFTYTPNSQFNGTEQLRYAASDGLATSPPATITITVTEVNDPPIGRRNTATTRQDQALAIPTAILLANDSPGPSNETGQPLAVTAVSASSGTHGTVTLAGDTVTYVPTAGYLGTADFGYTVCDSGTTSSHPDPKCTAGTVSVNVTSKAPSVVADTAATPAGTPTSIDVLTNDAAVQGALDPRTLTLVTTPSLGSAVVDAATIVYIPNIDASGVDTLAYKVCDTVGGCGQADVTITITTVSPPTAAADSYNTQQGKILNIPAPGVLVNDGSPDPHTHLTVQLETDAAHGSLILRPDGSFSYTPNLGFSGTDTFAYRARSQGRTSGQATAEINVKPGLPAPRVTATTPADGTTVTNPVIVTATLTPPPGETITAWAVSSRRPGDSAVSQLASGSGTAVSASFDPTGLPNGTYLIAIRAQASGGGNSVTESSLLVDGDFKPGRYTQTWQDLTIDAGPIPIGLRRTYNSIDKTTRDFGVGWKLDFSDFRIDTNGALGAGGWRSYTCGSFPFLASCYRSDRPHVVTVTWPDGHVDSFDLNPTRGSTLLPALTEAAFVPRPGTTSTLRADDALLLSGGDLLAGGFFGQGAVYDPHEFLLTDRSGTEYMLDRLGGLRLVRDRQGNTLSVQHDGIIASAGPSVHFQRDSFDRITKVTDATGGAINYSYSPGGDLVEVVDRGGHTTTLSYSGNHYLIGVGGASPLLRVDYGPDGRISTITDGVGNTTTFTSDVAGRQETAVGPDPRLTTVTTYSDQGDITRIDKLANGHSVATSFVYDSHHQLIRITDPSGTTTVTYNAQGDATRVVRPSGSVTEVDYDDRGDPIQYRVNGQTTMSLAWNAAGVLEAINYPDGSRETATHDQVGRLLIHTDRSGHSTRYTYDERGVPIQVSSPLGRTDYALDNAGRVTQMTDATGATSRFGHDQAGQLTSFTDPLSHTWQLSYDTANRLTAVTDPLGRTRRYSYDPAGRLRRLDNRAGQSVTYGYGPDGQVTSVSGSDGTSLQFTYDPLGRLVRSTDAVADITTTWDDRSYSTGDTVSLIGQPAPVQLKRTSNPVGAPTMLTDPHGTTTFSYDLAGNLRAVDDTQAGRFSFDYDLSNQLTTLTRPNGTADLFTYRAGIMQGQVTQRGSAVLAREDYSYGANGLLAARTDVDGTSAYSFDAVGRLVSATHPPASGLPGETFTYDGAGNRTSWAANPASDVRFDAADRLLSDGRAIYTYDGEGRLESRRDRVSGVVTTYDWNCLNQLVGLQRAGLQATFGYDAQGRRSTETVNSRTTFTIHDGRNPRLLLDHDGKVVARLVHSPQLGDELAIIAGGITTYPVLDNQGTSIAATDTAGMVVKRWRFGSFGNPVADVGDLAAQWQGLRSIAGGLDMTWLRPYDPTAGRFLSEDPLPARNPYPYTDNNPLAGRDPTGLQDTQEEGGIYVLVDEEGTIVRSGRTKDLLRRAAEHRRRFPGLDFQTVFRTNSYAEQRGLEQIVHQLFNPELNAIGGLAEANANVVLYLESAFDFLLGL